MRGKLKLIWTLLIGAALLGSLKRQRSPTGPISPQSTNPERSQQEAQSRQPSWPPPHSPQQGWHSEESRHHRYERRYWRFSSALTFIAACGAIWSVILSQMSLEASRKSVFEAHRQADIAENSLFETLRPWVNLESLELYSDATWKDGQFELEVRIRVKNVGHNPALSVSVATQLVTIFPNKAVVTELRKMCDLRRELMPGALGSDTGTLFPDQEADSIVWGLSVNRDDVDAARQFFKETAKLEDYIIMPAISLIACVDYLIPGNTKHHQTGRIYSISARDNVPPNSITGFRHNQDVRKELLTSVHELHGDFAD